MGSNMEEAVRDKAIAEKQFLAKNFVGAQSFALKAQALYPELEGISQMVVTFGVYVASQGLATNNGESNFYSILGLHPSVEKFKMKKQYKKLAMLLHPDNNKTVGADGAFRLVSEAWTLLSDSAKRKSYDQRRSLFPGSAVHESSSKFSSAQEKLDTFWTVCTSCHVQYEYLRKYVNKRLSCKNCRGVFVAVESVLAPQTGTFPYNSYPYVPEKGYASLGCRVQYTPPIAKTGYSAPDWSVSGEHNGYRSENVSNISFQGSSSSGKQSEASGKHQVVKAKCHVASKEYTGHNGASRRPAKKTKVELGTSYSNDQEEVCPNIPTEAKLAGGGTVSKPASKTSSLLGTLPMRGSAATAFDGRKLLIDKARSEIRTKLEEMRLAAEAEAEKRSAVAEVDKQPQLKRSDSLSITVPDSDFHDFDKDRSEECFKPKQIWAMYDEGDGMPRLYCIIREVVSVKPFKIYISYLSSKSTTDIGCVDWLQYGFTKSCGSFRVFYSETVEQVNIFSHLLSREKAGRGGCVRIYPRSGDIWALFRHWSSEWNRSARNVARVRQQYEMVEIVDEYSEENGIPVIPVIKLNGFKTVYQRNTDKSSIRWIPREELLRFSHQVPSCALGANLPKGCWDLDPAATPDEFLHGESDQVEERACVELPQEEAVELPQGECGVKACSGNARS